MLLETNERQQATSANRRTHLTESEMLEILELARTTDARDWAMLAVHFITVSELLKSYSFAWQRASIGKTGLLPFAV